MSGPIPKRDAQRRRANAPAGGVATSAPGAESVPVPEPSEEWHPLARDWFASLAESGQSVFYEPSDWQAARVWATLLTKLLNADKPSPEMAKAWQSGAAELLTTEGARRRLRLELTRPGGEEDAGVSELDDYRKRLRTS